jgi:predicted amidohydrolase YtcJ
VRREDRVEPFYKSFGRRFGIVVILKSREEQIASVPAWCQRFAAVGIGGVRDPIVSPEGMRLYQAALQEGALSLAPASDAAGLVNRVSCRADRAARQLCRMAKLRRRPLAHVGPQDRHGRWARNRRARGAKRPFPQWPIEGDPDDLEQLVRAAVERRWRIGTHAIGDRSVRTLFDVYERVLSAIQQLRLGHW